MEEEEREKYHNLIIKFFAGELDDNEILILKSWLDQNPDNRRIFNEENELWQGANVHSNIEHFKTDTAWINISAKLGIGKTNSKSFAIISRNNYRKLLAAATVTCLVALGGVSLWISAKTSFEKISGASTTITTNEGEKAHVFLPDSSEIILNSGSTIQYSGNYNFKDRVLKLTGEAFFNVFTNHEKPLIVELEHMKIIATGTRFNVFSFDNEDRVETTLEEGTIEVSIEGKAPLTVKQGQQVVYFRKSEKVLLREVATDTYTSWRENKLRFNDTPFEEVLRRIGRKYNVKFEITNRDLLNLKYTATFIDESIEEVMQMLKAVSPINYKIYNRTSVNDKQYLEPRIVVGKRKTN
jgi:transmembrane sensor